MSHNVVNKIVDFITRKRDDKYFENLENEGKKYLGDDIAAYILKKHGIKAVEIAIIGSVNPNENDFNDVKNNIIEGNYTLNYAYSDLQDNIILLFQIKTLNTQFVFAFIDTIDFELPNVCLWFQEIKFPISINNQKSIYFSRI